MTPRPADVGHTHEGETTFNADPAEFVASMIWFMNKTAQSMKGEIEFEAALRARVGLLKGLPLSEVRTQILDHIEAAHRVLGALLNFSPGAFGDFARRHVFELLLLGIFALSHRYDRHSILRLAVQRVNKSVVWAAIGAMFVLAIAIGQGSSGK